MTECLLPSERGDVRIRKYPFPYRAALAVSNDCDSCSIEIFEDWHGFVNGTGATPYGDGLGLEVGDSFWVFAGRSFGLPLYTGFADGSLTPWPHAERIAELGRMGWFDTLHCFGNWNQDYKSVRHDLGTRAEIERGLQLMQEKGLKPFVFVNHSWSPSNIAGPWGFYQKLDDPNHPMHAFDLMQDFGFRYYWPDYAMEMAKFGDQLEFADDEELRKAIADYKNWKLIYRRKEDRRDEILDFAMEDVDKRALFLAMFNRTLVRMRALDGSPLTVFKRYRGAWAADESSFGKQASRDNLDGLEARQGAVVLYQHFGVTRRTADGSKKRSLHPVLGELSVQAWRDIAERHAKGNLFLTTTGRLLDYLNLAEKLDFTVDKSSERWTITLSSLENSAEWSLRPSEELLNGISFTVPEDAPEIVILDSRGRILDLERRADPVHPGKHAVYRQWRKLEWIPPTSS